MLVVAGRLSKRKLLIIFMSAAVFDDSRREALDLASYPVLLVGAVLIGVVIGALMTVISAGGAVLAGAVGAGVVVWLLYWTNLKLRKDSSRRDGL
jgi:membrane associated rhomboid family serine protease